MSNKDALQTAKLIWDEQGLPLSEQFGDYYFSKKNGLDESRYVYLENNLLPQRFKALRSSECFVIAETGFGSGLNFLATWQLWSELAPSDATLHFISVEKYPLTATDLKRSLELWPELQSLANELQQSYPAIVSPGFHRLSLAAGRIQLTLIFDDALIGLEQLLDTSHPAFRQSRRTIDAWYLDGFSPPKNPELWRPELFQLIALLSTTDTTLTTFSAASLVNRGLKESGFHTEKVKGYGLKREMLRAKLLQSPSTPSASEFPTNAFSSPHTIPWMSHSAAAKSKKNAVIIGAGMAGCHTAMALAQRGWQITLLDQHPQVAAEGSGNPQGALYAKLSHRRETLGDFNLLALQFALRFYHPFWSQQIDGCTIGQQCGVLQLAYNRANAKLQEQLDTHFGKQPLFESLSLKQASTISGIDQKYGGHYFPNSGWLDPRALCQALIQHPNIKLLSNCKVTAIKQSSPHRWQLVTNQGSIETNTVVLCTAGAIKEFAQTERLPVKQIRGQITTIPATDQSRELNTVICGDGYISPQNSDFHCLGATFDLHSQSLDVTDSSHQENLDKLSDQIPALKADFTLSRVLNGRAAFRCTTPDYMPLVGSAPRYQEYIEKFALLRKNAKANIPHQGPRWEGLYVNVGYGSRGLAYSPICAQILAAQINGEVTPVGRDLETAMHPARFWIRDLVRRKI